MKDFIFYRNFVIKSKDFLVDYIKKYKIKSLVLGISGGIDSTVVAAIASFACKECGIPLIGRSLPCSTNKEDEVNTATLVGEAFCDDFKEINIEGVFNNAMHYFIFTEKEMNAVQLGNLKARIRMMYLYNVASLNGGIVLDTDNLSEHLLGFWTLKGDEGDINCGLNYLYKTEVYKLAEALTEIFKEDNEIKAIKDSIALTPTDGNGVSTSDCDQFGLKNYDEVDEVLKEITSPLYTKAAYDNLVDKFGKDGVDRVIELHKKTEYKRKHLPITPGRSILFVDAFQGEYCRVSEADTNCKA